MDSLKAKGASEMPTAAKAVALIVMALVGWAMADVLMYRHPEYQSPGISNAFLAIVGGYFGWCYPGSAAKHGYRAAWGAGISGAFVAYVTVAALTTGLRLYQGMQRHFYKSISDFLDALVNHFVTFASLIFDGPVFVALICGGLLSGIFAGFAARIWR